MDMRDDIIYVLYDNWCNSEHEPEIATALNRAIQNPTEDTIFQAISITEANAFKAGARAAFNMLHCLFTEED